MAFRFWRRLKIAPGITLNLSKSGGSLSFGPRGAKYTVGPRGKRATFGIPGTGLFYTIKEPARGSSRRSRKAAPESQAIPPEKRLTLGFFKRLTTPKEEQAFVNGCRELALGDESLALQHLRGALHLADAAYLAGFLALKRHSLSEAERCLQAAEARKEALGRYFRKYGIAAGTSLPITNEIAVHVEPTLRGILLGFVELYQRQQKWRDAIACLKRLLKSAPDDVVIKLSLAELLLAAYPTDRKVCARVVEICRDLDNETPIHAALLLYKGRALHRLGLLDAARDTLTLALRRRKGRSPELLRALRYERALLYEETGKAKRARSEFEKLYAEAPDYEDVAERLGI